jgi:transposase
VGICKTLGFRYNFIAIGLWSVGEHDDHMHIDISPPKRIHHLPLVMDIFRNSGMKKVIDDAITMDKRSHVATSDCVGIILSGVMVGAHSLWRLRERLDPYDMNTIMQNPSFDLSYFNEERLAKALDDLYNADIEQLMTKIAIAAIKNNELNVESLHFDTTSLSFYGDYENEDSIELVEGISPPPKITYGYSKDNRPDLKQLLFGSLVTADGGIPIFGKAMNGNTSDSVAAGDFFNKIRELIKSPQEVCCISDCKGWCANVLNVVDKEKLNLLSRLPRNHQLHQDLMNRPWENSVIISKKSKNGKVVDQYECYGYDVEETHFVEHIDQQNNKQKTKKIIKARALRIFSSALMRTKLKTIKRIQDKEKKQSLKTIREFQSCVYACEQDAQRAAQRHIEQNQWITLNLTAKVQFFDGPVARHRGRPRKRPEPELASQNHYRIQYSTEPTNEKEIRQRLHDQSCFILIRTISPTWSISDEEMLDRYRGQYCVEHGFSWLKSGACINPMFLETPHRIAALCFIYCLGLMIWTLIQRNVRKFLKKTKQGLPYHRGKLSDHITTRFVFELFQSVQSAVVNIENVGKRIQIFGLEKYQKLAMEGIGISRSAYTPVLT